MPVTFLPLKISQKIAFVKRPSFIPLNSVNQFLLLSAKARFWSPSSSQTFDNFYLFFSLCVSATRMRIALLACNTYLLSKSIRVIICSNRYRLPMASDSYSLVAEKKKFILKIQWLPRLFTCICFSPPYKCGISRGF